jgi:hypothetical protein
MPLQNVILPHLIPETLPIKPDLVSPRIRALCLFVLVPFFNACVASSLVLGCDSFARLGVVLRQLQRGVHHVQWFHERQGLDGRDNGLLVSTGGRPFPCLEGKQKCLGKTHDDGQDDTLEEHCNRSVSHLVV